MAGAASGRRAVRRALKWRPSTGTALVVGLVVLGLWMSRHVYGHGLAAGGDATYHVARNTYGIDHLFLRFHLDGWSPDFSGGSQHFLLYGPGTALLGFAGRILTLGVAGDASILAAISGLALVATAPAMYLLGRILGLRQVGAAVAGGVSLAISVPFGGGVAGTFGNGLVPHQIALPLSLVSLAGIARVSEGPSRRWMAVTATTLAAVVVIHPVSMPIIAIAASLILALGSIRQRPALAAVRRLLWVGAAALAASCWWWYALIGHASDRPPLASWGNDTLGRSLVPLLQGRDWADPVVALIVALSIAIVAIRLVAGARDDDWLGRWAWAIAGSGLLTVVASHYVQEHTTGDLSLTIVTRSQAMACLLATLAVGAVADLIAQRPQARGAGAPVADDAHRPDPDGWAVVAGLRRDVGARGAALLLLACLPVLRGWVPAIDQLGPAAPIAPALEQVRTELAEEMKAEDTFVWVSEAGFDQSFGTVHPADWLVMTTGHHTLNGIAGNVITTIDTYLPSHLAEQQPADFTRLADRAGARFVVIKPETALRVVDRAAWRELSNAGGLAVYERRDERRWAVTDDGSPAPVQLTRWSAEAVEWKVEQGGSYVTLSIPAFSKWEVRVDGRPAQIVPRDGYLRVMVPAGASTISARFHRTLADRLGIVFSVVAGAELAYLLWTWSEAGPGGDRGWWRGRRRRDPDPEADAGTDAPGAEAAASSSEPAAGSEPAPHAVASAEPRAEPIDRQPHPAT